MTRLEFNYIIIQNSGKLFRVAYRILNNRQEAEDAVQDVFMKMWSMQSRLEEYNDPAALAMVMVRNTCIDILHKWKYQDPSEYNVTGQKIQFDRSPHELLVETESEKIIIGIISKLPVLYREAVTMKDIQGLDYEEIAGLLNVNISTLRVTISRGRQMIREQYIRLTDERRKIKRTAE